MFCWFFEIFRSGKSAHLINVVVPTQAYQYDEWTVLVREVHNNNNNNSTWYE